MNCPYCGRLADANLDSCPHCGGLLRKAAASAAKAGAGAQTCPSCQAEVQDGDIICVNCGTNLLTGQKVAPSDSKAARVRPQIPVRAIAVGALVVVALVVVAFLAMILLHDPVKQARELRDKGRPLEAIEVLQEFVETHDQDTEAFMLLGQLQKDSGEFLKAAEAFETAARTDPTNADALKMALICQSSGRRTAGASKQAEVLERLVRMPESDAQTQRMLGVALARDGQLTESESTLNEVAASDDSQETFKAQGLALALNNKPGEALDVLQKALDQNPGDGDLQAAVGFVEALLDTGGDPVERLKSALQIETVAYDQVLTQLGIALYQDGRYREANPYLEKAARSRGSSDTARLYSALCLAGLGRLDEALKELTRLSAGQGAHAQRAAIQVARLRLSRGEIELAQDALERARKLGGANAELHTLQGILYSQSGSEAEAREAYRRAIETDPMYAPARLESGLLHIKRQVFDKGLDDLERYLMLVGPEQNSSALVGVRSLVAQLRQTGGTQ